MSQTKRKYNVAITNWDDSTVEFCESKGGKPGNRKLTIINGEKYLYLSHDNALFSSNCPPESFEIECDWLTELELVKALVCETDDDVLRPYCLYHRFGMFHIFSPEWKHEGLGKDERKATLEEILAYFRKDKEVLEPIGVEEGEKVNREPYGYKVKDEFKYEVLKLLSLQDSWQGIFIKNSEYYNHLSRLKVLDIWCEPYYEPTIEDKIKDKLANFLLQKLSKEEFVNEIKELFNR